MLKCKECKLSLISFASFFLNELSHGRSLNLVVAYPSPIILQPLPTVVALFYSFFFNFQ